MATEIERKYLVANDDWRKDVRAAIEMRQGYMSNTERASVRVRVEGEKATLNIKSATLDIQRQEYEYAIPLQEGHEMLDALCERPFIEKTRYLVDYEGYTWEVDVFAGDNAGLVVAEVELPDASVTPPLPAWAGKEVSDDPRYYNVCLVSHPYKDWADNP